jgi:dTDP-4-dehydrorhamnose reductase
MKPRILLTGKTGQIGSYLCLLLEELGEVIAPGRNELDLSNSSSIRETVRDVRPSLIVNAAAYTAVDAAETDEPKAYAINAVAPGVLAGEARRIGARVVHYSTDYVFDGQKRTPYVESDPANPLNAYGRTKLAGEQAVRDSGAWHLIFRTSWVYATRGRNFMLTILRLASEREELRIVRDQIGAPTCAKDVALATRKVLAHAHQAHSEVALAPGASGTYHMTAAGQASWCDFAEAIVEEARKTPRQLSWLAAGMQGRELIAKRVIPISTQEFPSPTKRPSYSVLSNSRLTERFGVALPDWRTQLHGCFASEAGANLSCT